jgi:hypothetical protein
MSVLEQAKILAINDRRDSLLPLLLFPAHLLSVLLMYLLSTVRNCSDCSQYCAEQGEKCELTSVNNHFLTQFSAILAVS